MQQGISAPTLTPCAHTGPAGSERQAAGEQAANSLAPRVPEVGSLALALCARHRRPVGRSACAGQVGEFVAGHGLQCSMGIATPLSPAHLVTFR